MKRIRNRTSTKQVVSFGYSSTCLTNVRVRIFTLISLFSLLFFGIFLRLFHLQVVHGADYRERSDNNRILVRKIPAARGVIYDRTGIELVTNQPVQRLLSNDKGKLILDSEILDREQTLAYEATDSSRLVTSIGRYYPLHSKAAHLVGYVSEANRDELEEDNLIIGEMVGKEGLERSYNDDLMGIAGDELIELDAGGTVLRRVVQKPTQPGKDLILYLDAKLQQKIYDLFENRPGAGIVSNPQTGAIYSLVSSPSFDPNRFGYSLEDLGVEIELEGQDFDTLFTSEERSLVNRAIAGTYPPGSVYKVVTSIAALESGVMTASDEIEDTGVLEIDDYRFRNWYYTKYGLNDGQVNLTKALQRSNDIYYYQVGGKIGIDTLASWSEKFGLGRKTGIDLPGELEGLVPNPIWKERVKAERWFLGNTYHMSIGQGDLLTTPLQVNQMMGLIANGGKLCRPLLVSKIGTVSLDEVNCYDVGIEKEHIDAVVEGLIAACKEGGTGFPFFDFKLSEIDPKFSEQDSVGCKTGTAQFYDSENRTHAWFSVFAPVSKPEVMMTVLVEAGGEGSEHAAPIAREAMEYWFQNQKELTTRN